jgi:hypothetical protein
MTKKLKTDLTTIIVNKLLKLMEEGIYSKIEIVEEVDQIRFNCLVSQGSMSGWTTIYIKK